jgi:hypothetical protein
MRIKSYEKFVSEEIDLRKALLGTAIGASSLIPSFTNAAHVNQPAKPDTITTTKDRSLHNFLDTLEQERPELFDPKPLSGYVEFGKFERLSYLVEKKQLFEAENDTHIDLDILSKPNINIPFRINYFYVRGIDNLEGPLLMSILKVDFTKAVEIGGHDVMFNFTRVQDVNTVGARINF